MEEDTQHLVTSLVAAVVEKHISAGVAVVVMRVAVVVVNQGAVAVVMRVAAVAVLGYMDCHKGNFHTCSANPQAGSHRDFLA